MQYRPEFVRLRLRSSAPPLPPLSASRAPGERWHPSNLRRQRGGGWGAHSTASISILRSVPAFCSRGKLTRRHPALPRPLVPIGLIATAPVSKEPGFDDARERLLQTTICCSKETPFPSPDFVWEKATYEYMAHSESTKSGSTRARTGDLLWAHSVRQT